MRNLFIDISFVFFVVSVFIFRFKSTRDKKQCQRRVATLQTNNKTRIIELTQERKKGK